MKIVPKNLRDVTIVAVLLHSQLPTVQTPIQNPQLCALGCDWNWLSPFIQEESTTSWNQMMQLTCNGNRNTLVLPANIFKEVLTLRTSCTLDQQACRSFWYFWTTAKDLYKIWQCRFIITQFWQQQYVYWSWKTFFKQFRTCKNWHICYLNAFKLDCSKGTVAWHR